MYAFCAFFYDIVDISEGLASTVSAYPTTVRDECFSAINDWYPDQKGRAVSCASYPLGNGICQWKSRRRSIQEYLLGILERDVCSACSFSTAPTVFCASRGTVGSFPNGYICIRDSISFDMTRHFSGTRGILS